MAGKTWLDATLQVQVPDNRKMRAKKEKAIARHQDFINLLRVAGARDE